MRTSAKGMIDLIDHEGICLKPYLDSVNVWTLGIGHTAMAGPPDPKTFRGELDVLEAIELFRQDIVQYEDWVTKYAGHLNLKQHEFDALTSFCLNLGPKNLQSLVRNRSKAAIADAILYYINAGGKPNDGLRKRRNRERNLFLHGTYTNKTGQVPVFPVVNSRPVYSRAKMVDIREYFDDMVIDTIKEVSPETDAATNLIVAVIRWIAGLFK